MHVGQRRSKAKTTNTYQVETLEAKCLFAGDALEVIQEPAAQEVVVAPVSTEVPEVGAVILPEGSATAVSGELRRWHKLTFDFQGPNTSETATVNPFTDYRLDVLFVHPESGKMYLVPGYYAADGDAANTSASSGSVWTAHFSPDEIGTWNYYVAFRTGDDVAMDDSSTAGESAGFFDGESGSFEVVETDKTGDDFRAHGRLEYVGERYLQFAGSGEYFLKQGADAPENLLAYEDFDGSFKTDGQGDTYIKDYDPHVGDWNDGDPTWGDDKGKGLIGALNYLASEEMNAISFLPMNIQGDDKNVFPYLDYNERLRMDVSRLAQWEIVFEHADQLGIFLHFKTQETENDQLLDGGDLGPERKLYYRELIARFGHHLALNWNLGEENTNTTQQQKDFAQFFRDVDPYDHHIVIHTYPGQQDQVYNPLLGSASELTGASIQTSNEDFRNVHADTLKWVQASEASGKPWAVAVDEPGDAQHALRPDNDAGNSHTDGRKNALWGTLMAGGWGNEYYFGYGHAHSDLTLEDFRSRDDWWDYARYALDFFEDNEIPFWEMNNDNGISSASDDYGFYKEGDTYVVYLKSGGTTNLDLSSVAGTYDVRWYDPRNGGALQFGSVAQVSGGGQRSLGEAPNSTNDDWVILVRLQEDNGVNDPPVVSILSADYVPPSTGNGFQEEDGLVVIEIESQPATDSWELQTSVPGYTGDGYYRWEGPDLFNSPGTQGLIEYTINITNPGTYQMRFHNHRDGDIAFDQENDVWAKLDDGSWIKIFSGTQGVWNWASNFDFGEGNRPSASYELSAGEHTFTIAGRSNGFRIDRVVFYNTSLTSASEAQNLNNPQSPTSSGVEDYTYDLVAAVSDDGEILAAPELTWQRDAGPSRVIFTSTTTSSTRVTFSEPGVYRLKLTAFDGEFTTSATRVILVPPVELPDDEEVYTTIDDAYVQGSDGFNDSYIKAQPSGPERTGYFKFDVSGYDSSVTAAYLRLTVSEDPGDGTLNLSSATSSSWAEETINSSNAPGVGQLLDSVSGTHSVGNVIEFDVTQAITADGIYSFILEHGGGNDVWFSSKEGGAAPQLVLVRDIAPLVGDYDRNGVVDDADYEFWQIAYGSTEGDGLLADGNGDGVVNASDYTIWRDNYGAVAESATVSQPVTSSTPVTLVEPVSSAVEVVLEELEAVEVAPSVTSVEPVALAAEETPIEQEARQRVFGFLGKPSEGEVPTFGRGDRFDREASDDSASGYRRRTLLLRTPLDQSDADREAIRTQVREKFAEISEEAQEGLRRRISAWAAKRWS